MNLQDFLNKLDRVNWDSTNRNSLHSTDGWDLSIETKFLHGVHQSFRCQVYILVKKDGYVVTRYSSESNQDNDEMILWFIRKEDEVQNIEFEQEKISREWSKTCFDKL